MNPTRILAIALIAAGALALVYGGFTYTSGSSDVDLGVVKLSVKDRERVHVPVWAGVAGIAVGAVLLLRKSGR